MKRPAAAMLSENVILCTLWYIVSIINALNLCHPQKIFFLNVTQIENCPRDLHIRLHVECDIKDRLCALRLRTSLASRVPSIHDPS